MKKRLTILLALASLGHSNISYAQFGGGVCDTCVQSAVVATNASITSGFTAIGTQLTLISGQMQQIGLSLQQLNEGNLLGFRSVNQTLIEISKAEINEQHLLAEKIETLAIKRDINDKFGSVADDLCYDIEATAGNVAGNSSVELTVESTVENYINDIHDNTRGVGKRVTELNKIPDTINASDYINGDKVATSEMLEHLPRVLLALTESEEYEAPREASIINPLSTSERNYKSIYNTRQWSMQVVRSALRESIVDQSVPTRPVGGWVSTKLSDAGVGARGYVSGSMSTTAGVVQAIAHAEFGNEYNSEKSNISGDELIRKQIEILGQSNFLLAQNWKVASQTKLLLALQLGRITEDHYEEEMRIALLGTDQ